MGDSPHFTNYTTEDGLVGNHIATVCGDSQGRMWFGNGSWSFTGKWNGVSCFDGKEFTNYSIEDGLAGNNIQSICSDSKGNIWIAAFFSSSKVESQSDGGVSCYDGRKFINYNTKDGLPNNDVVSIHRDKQGRMWFGTSDGVCCFDEGVFTTYTTADGLLDNRVQGILQDREGILWFVHFHSGLTRFDEKTCQSLTESAVSESLIQTNKGSLWFGNTNRLCCLDNGEQRCVEFAGDVLSLMEDSNGHFWVGTSLGLYRYDSTDDVWEGRPKHFIAEDGLNSQTIYSLMETKDGDIWVGTAYPGYLCRFDNGNFQAIQTGHSLIQRLLEDNTGHIWMGGFQGGGLACYKSGQLRNYRISSEWSSNGVISIVMDDDNRLWIGTFKELYCYDGENFVPYGEKVSEYGMHQISAKDAKGHLWFGTNGDGIYRYDGRHFQQLTRADGLPSDTVTGLVPQPDGSMIIGTSKGIVHYHPIATMPPKIQIREVVADRVYPEPDELELTTTQASLVTIGYHGMSFSTNRMRYSYIFENYDKEWEDTWETQVRYEKLPPGEYTFKVIAINRDLVESESPAVLKINVVPDPRDEQIAMLESELERRNRELEAELQDAREMQLSLLPEAPPEIEGFDIAGLCEPATAVGGDYFTYIWLDEDRTQLGIVLMDATGHGMKAATTAFLANGMLQLESHRKETPGEIMLRMHESLQVILPGTAFVVMSFGVLDIREKTLTHFNAGQPAPILIRDGKALELDIRSDVPLGVHTPAEYVGTPAKLLSGDALLFFSDGLTEAEDSQGRMYDEARLWEMLEEMAIKSQTVQAWLDDILADVREFTGPDGLEDDLTLVVLRVL